MKIAFSSLACPSWDLNTIIDNASSMGFDGVELRGLQGELHLPCSRELAGPSNVVRNKFVDQQVELVCLSSSATLSSKNRHELAKQKDTITEYIELAQRLECPFVRIFAGEVDGFDNTRAAMGRVAEALISLVPLASRSGVTLLVENGGDFLGSDDMWFLSDAANHPAVKICWNQCTGMMNLERPTTSIPRLGNRIGMMHLCDADFSADGTLLKYQALGEGGVEVARQIELLRGLAYNRYLVFDWPKLWQESLSNAVSILPTTASWLHAQISARQNILSAYKADKNKPNYAAPTSIAS